MGLIDDIKGGKIDGTPDEQREFRIQSELDKLLDRDEAKRRYQTIQHPPEPLPVPQSLAHRLSLRVRPLTWRIENLFLEGQHNLLAAQFKAGKTTLVMNVVRSLLDGAPFLDRFRVTPVLNVTLIDLEMADDEPGQLDEWYREVNLRRPDGLKIVPLRGRAHLLNILDADIRARWAANLAGTEFLIIDPARPWLDALGLDENHEVGKLTQALDALCLEANIPEVLLVQHMGHVGERARGDSQYLAWPGVNWTLVRESDDPASKRYFKAYGRGVDVPETQLVYNPQNHRLGIGAGSRQDKPALDAIPAILAFVAAETTPPNQSAIRKAMKNNEGIPDQVVRRAIKIALKNGQLTETKGANNSTVYSVPSLSACQTPNAAPPNNPPF